MQSNSKRTWTPFLICTALFAFLYYVAFFGLWSQVQLLGSSGASSNYAFEPAIPLYAVLAFPMVYLVNVLLIGPITLEGTVFAVGTNGIIWGACLAAIVRFFASRSNRP
jgi:hypothetical protein